MIPAFRPNGNLPAGIYTATWEEFVARYGFTTRRQALLVGLLAVLQALRDAGCEVVYVDGSFVIHKPEPGDFDACWDLTGVDPARLDPVLLDFSNGRTAQKSKYLGELFPAQLPEGASGRTFLDFFQTDRQTGQRKGIVRLELGELP
jgi:hypothetical protein